MPTQYDFQNLEREIINLEKDAIKAVNSFNSITDTITRAKFNSSEYSQRAVSQKVSRIIDNTKNKTAAAYSNYLNSTTKCMNNSLNTVNQAAKTAGEYGNMLNAHLRDLDNLNKFFSNKRFRQVITTGINVDVFPAEIASYVLFLKLESYDAICKAYQENITHDNYHDFKEYHLLSKNNNAPKHLVSASSLLFIASYALSISDSNCPYDICLDGLKCYSDLPEDLRKLVQSAYDELYSIAIGMYNASCENAYSSFDYLKVKNLLKDSILFSKSDITNDFFRDSTASPEKLFEYASGYSSNASAETMQYVLVDTVSLSNGDTAKDYFAFWLKRYDDYGFVFIKQMFVHVFIDISQHFHRDLGKPCFRITHGSSAVTIFRTKVAVSVHQRVAGRPVLRHIDQSSVNGGVSVRMVFTHGITNDTCAFPVWLVRSVIQFDHREEDPPLYRF